MEHLRPGLFELGDQARANAFGRRRAQVELGQRGAQVEARPADDDRPAPFLEQLVDLRVGELRVLADAVRRVDGQERQQPVLQLRLLGRAGGARERL